MGQLADRMLRAVKLDPRLYEEVEADATAMPQAMLVVVLSSAAAGIGSMGMAQHPNLILGTLGALVGWYIWAFMTYWIGTKLLPEKDTKAEYSQLLRTIGFSSAPGILRVLGVVPFLTNLVFMATGIWMLVAMVIAVRQALDYQSTARAVGVCAVGWLIQLLFAWILFALMAGSAGQV
ncbi:MAG TPA: hypothetical protein DE315_01395 [Candidatus Omnitrophica bacterium]|nr:MAG: hypothetical protein A2Y05_02020 [Omnitrophica WOR_2 bacterium GWA2_53_43]HBO97845.1 hypothetical protein [Candidatus Omnitrophota bacterium]HCI44175.1 hypothetical protein [Candidatus Omnitrophota bacterium]